MRAAAHVALVGAALVGVSGNTCAQTEILSIHSDSLTTYKVGATPIQDVAPLAMQRGAHIDGSGFAGGLFGAALRGDPFGVGSVGGRVNSGGIDLATGAAMIGDIDLSLPAEGIPWVIGRTYSAVQDDSGHHDSDGYQGRNWHQMSQPEIVFHDDDSNPGTEEEEDMVYLVYGADRFIEFRRVMDESSPTDVFRAVNGAAGVIVYEEEATGGEPDTYTYTDMSGNEFVFFGFDGDASPAEGSLWKTIDPAGDEAYIGDASTKSTAISSGYDGSGRISVAYDASDRRYTYTYTSLDSTQRLTSVEVETKTGGTWASPTGLSTIEEVDYTYYTDEDHGSIGDLKTVTITTPMTDSGVNLIRSKYYRYWDEDFHDTTSPGHYHAIQYIVDFEGVRNFDYADSTFDNDHFTASDSVLKPYASAYYEYNANHQIDKAWANGECGCSGASNGVYNYEYESNGSYSDNAGYDQAWMIRAITERPDGSYETQYIDETGQSLDFVLSDEDPGTASNFWVTDIVRNASGQVTEQRTPANASSYNHTNATWTNSTTVGLIWVYERAGVGVQEGFASSMRHRYGTDSSAGNDYFDRDLTYDTTSLDESFGSGAYMLVRPVIDSDERYPQELTVAIVGLDTTSGVVVHGGAPLVPMETSRTNPTVTTATNGANSPTMSMTYRRVDGSVAFNEAEDGVFDYTLYEDGVMTKSIHDAQTNHGSDFASGDDPNTDFGITETGDGFHRVTTYTYDPQGRRDTVTASHGMVSKSYYSLLKDRRIVSISIPRMVSGTTFYGPASYSVMNHAGQAEFSGTIAITSSGISTALTGWIDEGEDDPITALDIGSLARMSTNLYSESGYTLLESRAYFDIPASGDGTDGTNFDATQYGYDDMGRRWRTKDATGTISRQSFDSIGRPLATYIGTNDSGFAGGEPSGTDDMVKVSETVYDTGATGGNSYVTKRTTFVEDSTTDERVTDYTNDGRGRAVIIAPPAGPVILNKYDNFSRVVAVGQYSSTANITVASDPTTETDDRIGLSQTFFDAKGQVWKTQMHQIDDSDGSDDDSVQAFNWYDSTGRNIKTVGSSIMKTRYDRLGRATHSFVLARTDDPSPSSGTSYAAASTIVDDIVLEEMQTIYDDDDLVVMSVSVMRDPDDVGGSQTTGELDTNADTDDLLVTAANVSGRVDIAAFWYDDWRRQVDTVNYGTYGGSNFDRDGLSVPARSDTALRTTTAFNDDGTVLSMTDPEGIETRYAYDDLGRQITVISNYADGSPGGGANDDEDQVVQTEYTDGLRTKLIADLAGGGDDQETIYTYGVAKGASAGDSKIGSGRLLYKVQYPDSAGGSDVVTYAYNALGQTIWMKDQSGNIIETTYDDAGRTTDRAVTTLDADFDGAVRLISMAYTSRSQVDTVTQYDAATSGSVVDQVRYTYDDWGYITDFDQDRNSAISGDEYTVSYAYAQVDHDRNGGYEVAETVRRTGMTQPDGSSVTLSYLTTYSSIARHDDDVSRVTAVQAGATYVASYGYAGTGMLVETRLDEASVYSNLYNRESGAYTNLDRFNRVTTSAWAKDMTTDFNFVELAVTWDRGSSTTRVEDHVLTELNSTTSNFDWALDNDDLGRLIDADRGDWTGSAIGTTRHQETWTLDPLSNWDRYKLDLDGDGSYTDPDELDDTRTHNKANELLTRDIDTDTSVDFTLVYDEVGNLTDDGETYEYVYDPFGRLRKVLDRTDSSVVAEYRYNGLGFRINEHYDVDTDGDVDGSDNVYYFAYTPDWQLAATFRDSDSDPKETFLWHQSRSSYIDSVIHVNRDISSGWTGAADGTLEIRYHPLQSWRADVVCLINSDGTQVLERVTYDPYGTPAVWNPADTGLDGVLAAADYSQFVARANNSDVLADLNLDGAWDLSDVTVWTVLYNTGDAGGRETLSLGANGNRIGYAGALILEHAAYYCSRPFIYDSCTGIILNAKSAINSIPRASNSTPSNVPLADNNSINLCSASDDYADCPRVSRHLFKPVFGFYYISTSSVGAATHGPYGNIAAEVDFDFRVEYDLLDSTFFVSVQLIHRGLNYANGNTGAFIVDPYRFNVLNDLTGDTLFRVSSAYADSETIFESRCAISCNGRNLSAGPCTESRVPTVQYKYNYSLFVSNPRRSSMHRISGSIIYTIRNNLQTKIDRYDNFLVDDLDLVRIYVAGVINIWNDQAGGTTVLNIPVGGWWSCLCAGQ